MAIPSEQLDGYTPPQNDNASLLAAAHSRETPKSCGADAPDAPPMRCCLGACDQVINDLSIKGLKNHISEAHIPQRNAYSRAGKVSCFWTTGNKICGKEVRLHGLAKHLATAHLSLTRMNCQFCGKSLARIDALLRHHRRDCKAIPEDTRTLLTIRCE